MFLSISKRSSPTTNTIVSVTFDTKIGDIVNALNDNEIVSIEIPTPGGCRWERNIHDSHIPASWIRRGEPSYGRASTSVVLFEDIIGEIVKSLCEESM